MFSVTSLSGNTLSSQTCHNQCTRYPYPRVLSSTAESPPLLRESESIPAVPYAMPGSESSLEELMSRVVGNLIEDGTLAKIADDLFCGGDTPEEALHNWSRLLAMLHRNNLGLSAPKTIIYPQSTTTLGWIWSSGTISASPHKISTLVSVDPPATVRGLRSFIGAYKVLSRVLRGYADYLDPMDKSRRTTLK